MERKKQKVREIERKKEKDGRACDGPSVSWRRACGM